MRRALILAIPLIAALPLAASQQPVFKAGVDVVRIDVSVMQGINPVGGLAADNFVVTDNGVVQKLDSVSLDRVPLSLMMVFDNSASLAGERLGDLIAAANCCRN
jgi:hypothetical protein